MNRNKEEFAWLQDSAAKRIKYAHNWDITHRLMVITYRRFGKNLSVTYSRAKNLKKKLILDFFTFDYGRDRLFRNVGNELPVYAV